MEYCTKKECVVKKYRQKEIIAADNSLPDDSSCEIIDNYKCAGNIHIWRVTARLKTV